MFHPPQYRHTPLPSYPPAAREQGLGGAGLFEAKVMKDGRVGEVKVKQSTGVLVLDESAQRTIKTWTFEPGRQGPNPVESWVEVPVLVLVEGEMIDAAPHARTVGWRRMGPVLCSGALHVALGLVLAMFSAYQVDSRFLIADLVELPTETPAPGGTSEAAGGSASAPKRAAGDGAGGTGGLDTGSPAPARRPRRKRRRRPPARSPRRPPGRQARSLEPRQSLRRRIRGR